MFLLNQILSYGIKCICDFFTFHNVSIKSGTGEGAIFRSWFFTFHNVSIKSDVNFEKGEVILFFTFHNVSIKSKKKKPVPTKHEISLHSTMFLLNLKAGGGSAVAYALYIPQCFY